MTIGLKWTLLGAHCEQCGEPMERRGGECGEANCDCHREQVYVHSSDGLIGCGGMRRIGVTGGRDYNDQVVVATAIASNALAGDIIVHGAARGADTLAHTAAPLFDCRPEPHRAQWEAPCRDACAPNHRRERNGRTCCPAAGNYRNQEMVDSGLDLLLAFPGGDGTADMVKRARRAGVEVIEIGGEASGIITAVASA